MSQRDAKVTCPCCGSRLEVDVRSGKVVRWSRAEELDATGKPVLDEADWDRARDRVQGRLPSAGDKLEEGFAREKSRERDLDDLFKKAREKLEGKGEE